MSEYTPIVTDDMVAEALDAKVTMSQLHCFLYATEKCRCGEDWTDAHWMRFILERALSRASVVAEEPEWEYGYELIESDTRDVLTRSGAFESEEAARHWARKGREDENDPDYPELDVLIVRRRKAGPWMPVPVEHGDDDA